MSILTIIEYLCQAYVHERIINEIDVLVKNIFFVEN